MAKPIVPTKPTLHEVLELVGKAPTKVDKAKVLKQYESVALKSILRGAFDDSLEFNLPKGSPPYEESRKGEARAANTHQSVKRLVYFMKGGQGDQIMAPKRERMFISIIETLLPEDAEIFIAMKDKKFMGLYKGVTKKLVQDTWPTLIKE
jgi:hypothetical protein